MEAHAHNVAVNMEIPLREVEYVEMRVFCVLFANFVI